jgi:hypothetical protein
MRLLAALRVVDAVLLLEHSVLLDALLPRLHPYVHVKGSDDVSKSFPRVAQRVKSKQVV